MKYWELLNKEKVNSEQKIIDLLLKNRNIVSDKEKKDFFNPISPLDISLESLDIPENEVKKAYERLKIALENNEHIVVYGDYDADGIDGTAILWETLHAVGFNVLPHIPDRFSEGYGLNVESIKKLKLNDPDLSLIITVDHGIVAGNKIKEVDKIGIDVIITDHHQKGKNKPKALATIYTDKISGSGVSWIFSREIIKRFKITESKFKIKERLQLAAIGTVADQLPLIGPNRSIVKFGIEQLRTTKRPGLLELIKNSGIEREKIGTYEIGFIIAPRINSMGRLKHAIESLRLLCTVKNDKAFKIAKDLHETNLQRQGIVDDVVKHAREKVKNESVIVLSDKSYHEGVIGLAAAKLVEEFYRPAIVLSENGEISKASARSIPGFNIIEAIRQLEDLYIEGGGHPMAAGFSIKTQMIPEFSKRINKIAKGLLTEEVLSKKLKIDMEIPFSQITRKLYNKLNDFEPIGIGNFAPIFISKNIEVLEVKAVGRDAKHLKLKLKQDEHIFDSIFFGGGEIYSNLTTASIINIAYQISENIWNGKSTLQLLIKDLKI